MAVSSLTIINVEWSPGYWQCSETETGFSAADRILAPRPHPASCDAREMWFFSFFLM